MLINLDIALEDRDREGVNDTDHLGRFFDQKFAIGHNICDLFFEKPRSPAKVGKKKRLAIVVKLDNKIRWQLRRDFFDQVELHVAVFEYKLGIVGLDLSAAAHPAALVAAVGQLDVDGCQSIKVCILHDWCIS